MTLTEKIKWLNKGITLGKWSAKVENCKFLTDGKRGQGTSKRIYLGTEDELMLFRKINSTLGLNLDYEVEDVDGEIEIVVKGVK